MAGEPKVLSGARAILRINNQITVYALSVNYQVVTEVQTINAIDQTLPTELAPTNIQVACTVSVFRIPRQSAAFLGLQANILNLMHQGYCSIEIQDRGTNETILYIPKAMLTKRASSLQARGISGETWSFTGIGYRDEQEPKKPTA